MTISATSQGLKTCAQCGETKPLEMYTVRRRTMKPAARCKMCNAKHSAEYRINNRERYLALKRAAYRKNQERRSSVAIKTNWDNLTVDEQSALGCGVYCITIADKFYIGSCVNFKSRMIDHTRKLGYGKHVNRYMQNSFNKHQMFEAELIEACRPDELESVEQRYIDQWFGHENCLNLRPNVKTMLGFRHSDATKAKLSAIFAGVNNRRDK